MFSFLDDEIVQELYSLKNYQTADIEKLQKLYDLISNRNLPGYFYNVLSKTLLRILMGDTPYEAGKSDNTKKAKAIISDVNNSSIVLAIGKLKEISGGAERVLIELANFLNSTGQHVVVVCTDGKGGNPFYALDEGISLIDLNEAPLNTFLNNCGKSDFSLEIDEVISKTPLEMLRIATADADVRSKAENWSHFLKEDNRVHGLNEEEIKNSLIEQKTESG